MQFGQQKKGPFSRTLQCSNMSLGNRPVWDNKIVTAYLLLVKSNNLPIHLRVCAKMFTSPSMDSDNFWHWYYNTDFVPSHCHFSDKSVPPFCQKCATILPPEIFRIHPRQRRLFDSTIITHAFLRVISILLTILCRSFAKSLPPFWHPLNSQNQGGQRRN